MRSLSFGSLTRRAKKVVDETVVSSGLSSALDRHAFRSAPKPTGRKATMHVLLAAPGVGNIGDQAMVEAFLEGVDGPVAIIVRDTNAIVIPEAQVGRAELIAMPHLLYSDGEQHFAALRKFRRLLGSARSFSVTGADIMDGKYSLRASVRRSNLAEYAATDGVDARILGFSWNGTPRKAALTALVRASANGVRPLLREPVSAARATAQGVHGVREVADIVFSSTSVDHAIAGQLGLDAGNEQRIVIVNVSGLIGRTLNQVAEYRIIIDHLRSLGRHVLLVPHVRSQLADDMVACAAVADAVGSDGVTFVDRMLTPSEIRGLASVAEFVITGRMHLAIMALWSGKPAITLATQGKVEGLMELFESTELCIEPTSGFGARILPVIDSLVDGSSEIPQRIRRRLPDVTASSLRNFDGIMA